LIKTKRFHLKALSFSSRVESKAQRKFTYKTKVPCRTHNTELLLF
jgi:hypothetical protein